LNELTGKNYKEYNTKLNSDAVQHIKNRHGASGITDKTMSDPKDIARIRLVMNNFDSVEFTGLKAKGFKTMTTLQRTSRS